MGSPVTAPACGLDLLIAEGSLYVTAKNGESGSLIVSLHLVVNAKHNYALEKLLVQLRPSSQDTSAGDPAKLHDKAGTVRSVRPAAFRPAETANIPSSWSGSLAQDILESDTRTSQHAADVNVLVGYPVGGSPGLGLGSGGDLVHNPQVSLLGGLSSDLIPLHGQELGMALFQFLTCPAHVQGT